jgi:hypothetical protein
MLFDFCRLDIFKLFTSVISTLLVVPVNLIVVTIFRKAKLKNSGLIPKKALNSKDKKSRRSSTQEIKIDPTGYRFEEDNSM